MTTRLLTGDCREVLKTLPDESVDCCVTSPPYFGLRDYGMAGQMGLEATPDAFVAQLVSVFGEVRRVLKPTGTVWLNLGDSYASSGIQGPNGGLAALADKWAPRINPRNANRDDRGEVSRTTKKVPDGLKAKDLIGIPWRVAFALQADGWYLRQDIIWSKPNPMPESITDRCTKAHEYIFLLAKSRRYYFDAEAIREENSPTGKPWGSERKSNAKTDDMRKDTSFHGAGIAYEYGNGRNKRSVWEIATQPFSEAHFATFPPALIEPCILAGCPEKACAKCGAPWVREVERGESTGVDGKQDNSGATLRKDALRHSGRVGERSVKTLGFSPSCRCLGHFAKAPPGTEPAVPGVVLDPFGGAGTTGLVADRLGRNAILIELNPDYAAIGKRRIVDDAPLFAEVAAE